MKFDNYNFPSHNYNMTIFSEKVIKQFYDFYPILNDYPKYLQDTLIILISNQCTYLSRLPTGQFNSFMFGISNNANKNISTIGDYFNEYFFPLFDKVVEYNEGKIIALQTALEFINDYTVNPKLSALDLISNGSLLKEKMLLPHTSDYKIYIAILVLNVISHSNDIFCYADIPFIKDDWHNIENYFD